MMRCWAFVCAWAGTGVPDGHAVGRADGCLRACHANSWQSGVTVEKLTVMPSFVRRFRLGERLRDSWGDGARPAARGRTLGCHDLCEFASGARPARLRRKPRPRSSSRSINLSGSFREGTGAKVVQGAEVYNNCERSFAHLSLHVDGCQTKLSHFDAVACNTEQCPDLSHARRRGLGINLIPQPMGLGIDLIPEPMGLGIDLIPEPMGLGSIP